GRLQDALERYKDKGRKRTTLLREPFISEAEKERDSAPADLTEEELAFITRSRWVHDLRIRLVVYGCVAATALATWLLIVAGKQWKRAEELGGAAERANQLALARQLGSRAELIGRQRDGNLQKAALLALSSLHLAPFWEADQTLRQALNLLP